MPTVLAGRPRLEQASRLDKPGRTEGVRKIAARFGVVYRALRKRTRNQPSFPASAAMPNALAPAPPDVATAPMRLSRVAVTCGR